MRAVAAALAALAVAACATPQTDRLRAHPGDIPARAEVADAVFFAQRTRECGPAALAMALVHSGLKVSPDDLVEAVYTPGREGSLSPALVAAARRQGRLAYPVDDMRSLFREVAAGRPVVVLQNLALPWIPQWHYAVVVGYDLDRQTVLLHSGRTARKTMPMATFERTWARGGYWGLLVLAPGRMPTAPVVREAYLKAAAGLEYAGRYRAARRAYAAAARRWHGDLAAHMGLGNSLYALGRRAAAADAFATAARYHPEAAEAHNNLAHVLMELGALDAAARAARRAVALGGPGTDTYRRTLALITSLRDVPEGAKPEGASATY